MRAIPALGMNSLEEIVTTRSLNSKYSSAMEIQDNYALLVQLHGPGFQTTLKIPKELIMVPTLTALGHEGEYISLEILYPEMAPLPEDARTHDFFHRSQQQKDLRINGKYMYIELHQGAKTSIEDLIKYNLKTEWIPEPPDRQYPDFAVFSDKMLSYSESAGAPIKVRYFLPLVPSLKKNLYLKCDTALDRPDKLLSCAATTGLSHRLYGNYGFEKTLLANWRDVDSKIRSLVSTLIRY